MGYSINFMRNISLTYIYTHEPIKQIVNVYVLQLPPGAVSPFGNLPPPVFNNGTLQQAQTANTNVPPIASKPDTQISCNPTTDVNSVFARSASVSGAKNNITAASSQLHEDVNQKYATSQPSQNNATAPGRTENISKGSLSSSGDTRRYVHANHLQLL